MLHVKALGDLTISDQDGREFNLSAKKARALFVYLACHAGKMFPREHLATLLWDDVPDARARTNLRQSVVSIRRLLSSAQETEVLHADRNRLGFKKESISLDVTCFQSLCQSSSLVDLEKAVEIYDGDLGHGLTVGSQLFDEWIISQNVLNRNVYQEAMLSLLNLYTETGVFDKAIATAMQILLIDELREDVHASLMKLYARIGRFGAALRQYRTCQEVLRRDLGVTPSQSTRTIYEEISAARGGSKKRGASNSESQFAATSKPRSLSSPPAASIAVIPFLNMSSDPEQDYFSDGLAEELLNLLASIRELRVAARTSAFQFRGKSADVSEIGQALNVSYVLEGSVRRSTSRVRITAQLIDTQTGYHVWSESFDRVLTDIFEVQDEIAAAIVKGLKDHLVQNHSTLRSRRTSNIDAYESFLQGQQLLLRRGAANIRNAQALFAKALELDPNYLPALISMADSHILLANDPRTHGDVEKNEACRLAKPFIDRALAIDPESTELAVVSSLYYLLTGDAKQAEMLAKYACDNNPNSAQAYNQLAIVHSTLGSTSSPVVEVLRKSLEIDPLSASTNMNLGLNGALHLNGEMVEHFADRLQLVSPDSGRREFLLGLLRWLKGDFAEGFKWFKSSYDCDTTGRGRFILMEAFVLMGEGESVEHIHPASALNRYIQIGNYERAAIVAEELWQDQPEPMSIFDALPQAEIANFLGKYDKVIELLNPHFGCEGPDRRELYGLSTALTGRQLLIRAYSKSGMTADVQSGLEKLRKTCDLLRGDPLDLPAFVWRTFAFIAMMEGDRDGSLEFLDLQFRMSPYYILNLKTSRTFEDLCDIPVFETLTRRIKTHHHHQIDLALDMNLLPYAGQLDD